MDHVRELQGRLFAIAVVFLLISAAVYPFFDKVVNFLVAPLGKDHQLVYLTPGGAFGFIIQVCMYIGLIGSLPVIMYHLYRFLMPAVKAVNLRRVLMFTVTSFLLAIVGILFAYYVSLPAALYFLTSFNLYHINPMLTIDSYFSFIMAYVLAGALLFQLPVIMMIVDSIKPLTPKKMMNYQRHIIVGSFVIAAIISPTPDALNQALLASPMVVMYQLGVLAIWIKHRRSVKKQRRISRSQGMITEAELRQQVRAQKLLTSLPVQTATAAPIVTAPDTSKLLAQKRSVEIKTVATRPPAAQGPSQAHSAPAQATSPQRRRSGSLDGFVVSAATPLGTPRGRDLTRPQQLSTGTRPMLSRSMPVARSSRVRTLDGFMVPSR